MLKVVVIDGNAISRNLLTSVLVNGGFNVIGDSNTSPAGLAAMVKLQPQLVCIDLGGADAEAFDKLNTIRTSLPKAVVFLASSQFDASAVQTAVERGVHGFIVKPFNAINVLGGIRKAIINLAKQQRSPSESNPT